MLTTKMLENTINHKKKTKIVLSNESNIQYELFNEYSLFSNLCTETTLCPKEAGNESDEIVFPNLCIKRHNNNQSLLQIQCEPRRIIPVAEISTIHVLLNDSDIVPIEDGKCIQFVVRIYIDYDDHYKAVKTIKNKILTSLEKKIYSSSFILPMDKDKCFTINSSTSKTTNIRIFMPIVENNVRHSINNHVLVQIVMKIIEIIMHKSTVESFEPKTALCPLFSKWYFQNITQGLRLKSILRNININVLCIIHDMLCLILGKAFTSSSMTVTITVIHIFSVPLEEFRDLSHCMRLISNTKCVMTDNEPIIVIKSIRNIFEEEKAVAFSRIYVTHQSTQTTRKKKYKDVVDTHTCTEFEREISEHGIKIHEQHSLNYLNPSIWLPKLCGDSCDSKISFMSYLLKCSCLNEALVNLDAAEKYIKTIYNVVLSPAFNKVFLKDLGSALVSTFINSVKLNSFFSGSFNMFD